MILIKIAIRLWWLILIYASYSAWSEYEDWKTNVYQPRVDGLAEKRSQIAAKQAEVDRAEDFEKRREEKLAELQRLGEVLDSTKGQLPRDSSVPSLLKAMADIADATGIVFSNFRPGSERRQQFLVETPVEVRLSGNYVQIMSFLDSVANLARVVNAQRLSFDSPQVRGDVSILTASVTLVTYHLDEAGTGGQ